MISCTNFFKFRPHLPFRFITNFYSGKEVPSEKIGLYVSSIKVNMPDVDTSTAATYYGDGYRTIPLVEPSSKTIDVTFEETDDMQVLHFLDGIIAQQRFGLPYVIQIGITEFEERMNAPVKAMIYSCILQSYEEPSFSRTGGVSLVTLNATFAVMSEKPWENNTQLASVGKQAADKGYNDGAMDTLTKAADKEQPSAGNFDAVAEWNKQFNADLKKGRKREAEEKEREEAKKREEEKSKDSSKSADTDLRPKSKKTKQIQDAEKEAAKKAGTSYLAVAMANGGEGELKGEGFKQRSEITPAELEAAKKRQAELDKTYGGKELQGFMEELSDKQYWLGKKGKDGVISGTEGLDCSGAAGAWAERMGYNINESTAGAKNGGLVKQLIEQGATDRGQNFEGLKPGDILNKTSTKEGNTGHVVIFLGYDSAGNMLIGESAGRTGEGDNQSAGGRVRTVSKEGMKQAGYTAVAIMDNAKKKGLKKKNN